VPKATNCAPSIVVPLTTPAKMMPADICCAVTELAAMSWPEIYPAATAPDT
jgi:hypothetical protein